MSEDMLIDIYNIIRQIKSIENDAKQLKPLKDKVREFMIDEGIPEINTDEFQVSIKRAHSSFDLELLRLEKPELFERYCKREEHTIITFENKITKANLEKIKEKHPELWNDKDYRKELTPRLSIK